MKRILLAITGLALAVSFISISAVRAVDMRSGDSIAVGSGEQIDSSLYIAGSTVTVAGTVDGDVFCAGQNINISGTVRGDVICGGQVVRIDGTVEGDVRIAGQTVLVGGMIEGSLTAAGQTVDLSSQARVGRDASLFGEALTMSGQVGRDIVGGGNSMVMSGVAGRNIKAAGDHLTLESTAKIGGNVIYTSRNQPDAKPGASISGSVERHDPPQEHTEPQDPFSRYLAGPLFGFSALLLVGLAGLLVAPGVLEANSAALRRRPLASLGLGLLGLFAIPVIAIMLFFTIIGALLGFVLLLTWMLALFGAFIVASYCTGQLLVEKLGWTRWRRVLTLALGLIVLIVLSALPYIGGMVIFLAIAWGMGAKIIWLHSRSALNKIHKPSAKPKTKA